MKEEDNSRSGGPTAGGSVQLVFVLTRAAGEEPSLPSGLLKLFVRAEELPTIYGSDKLAKILAKHCLTATVKSASRLTLCRIGDVISVADRLRRSDLTIDFRTRHGHPENAAKPTGNLRYEMVIPYFAVGLLSARACAALRRFIPSISRSAHLVNAVRRGTVGS
jgi:hypothetical protein